MKEYKIDFEKSGGIIPAIVQDFNAGDVLMLAYMNEEAFRLTQVTGYAHYYSRSKNRIWKKGESSDYVQIVKEIYLDCDSDTILLKVIQVGDAACHEGYRSCFFRRIEGDSFSIDVLPIFDPAKVYKD
ncbi:MAG: phosphoribosyl-AMP cyclohydrolase [Leptospirales bacterium]|nr:phosphoribosyl-AMP cyclohydrolase [Leptospirales bacterium]